MTEEADTSDISGLSFDEALNRLEEIVRKLESGQTPLEESIDLYQRGAALKQHCQARLDAARLRVEKVKLDSSGQAQGTEPAEFS